MDGRRCPISPAQLGLKGAQPEFSTFFAFFCLLNKIREKFVVQLRNFCVLSAFILSVPYGPTASLIETQENN